MDFEKLLDTESGALLTGVRCLSLSLTLDCGQAFRWREDENGDWRGVAFSKELCLRETGAGLLFVGVSAREVEELWLDYFDLRRDYPEICRRLSADKWLREACGAYPGIRVLRQDPWETLCSFIISQNNNIPRIKGIIERLCENFGERLVGGAYSFPSPERLAPLSEEDLAPLRAGFRAKYILDAARKASGGSVDLDALKFAGADEIRESLQTIKGVGAKVAECTLLYGFGCVDAFPVDVWVRRILEELYGEGLPECTHGVRGIAQQYLFHWRRMLAEPPAKSAAE